jgi:hypothetical protein
VEGGQRTTCRLSNTQAEGEVTLEMVEAAGVEPASEKVYRRRLRAFPIRWF